MTTMWRRRTEAARVDLVRGPGAWRELCAAKKRAGGRRGAATVERKRRAKTVQRLRRRLMGVSGDGRGVVDPAKVKIMHGGVPHPISCPCFDCLFGDVAAMKREARRPAGQPEVPVPMPGRLGRVTGLRRVGP